jgi:uncharacterized protein DUF1552
MIITKMALPRRTFLRGVGATVALPLLDAMVPALSALAKTVGAPVRRLGFMYAPNGMAITSAVNYWKPKGEGTSFELSPILRPLAPFRNELVVVSGLSHKQAEAMGDGNGDHTRGTATWLNGVHPKWTEGADVRAGTTADQVAAEELGKHTALPSIELGMDHNFVVGNCENGYSCVYMNTLAWRTPTTPLPAEIDPRRVFERLFGEGGTPEQRLAQMQKNRSILDAVTQQTTRLQQTLGPADRNKISDYLDGVREIERRIQRAEEEGGGSTLPTLERPMGIPERFDEHARLMFDLQIMAFQADITRVFTFMMGRETSSRSFPEIGLSAPHHGMSHHGNKPEDIEKYAKVNTYQVEQLAYFLEKLRATPDGDGTLLDHVLLLFGAGLSNGNEHSHIDLPLLVAGGASQLKGGRHIQYPLDTPMSNLLLSMLDKVGVSIEHLGDSTGRLKLEPLSGL